MNTDEKRALKLLREEGLDVDEMDFRSFCTIDATKRTNPNPSVKEIADRYVIWQKMTRDKEANHGKEPYLYKGDSVPHV